MDTKNFFKSKEDVVSMFIGLVIVVAVALVVVNLVSRNKGRVDVPGTSDQVSLTQPVVETVNKDLNQPTETTYKVVKGDYLSKIAKEKLGSGSRWTEIAKLNDIKNPNVLLVGQELKIPTVAGATTVAGGQQYKVVKGDSLWKISVNTYGDGYQWVKIWQENKVKLLNPGLLEIGMTLQLPQLK
jgi:nucleoid-associated protein YgaU